MSEVKLSEKTLKRLKRLKKKLRQKLPDVIIPIKNPDKAFHEKWTRNRNKLDIPHPFRAVALGPPNSGKTTIVKQILLRANPPFEEVFVIHCDPDYTQEYDDVGANVLSEIPAPTEWEGLVKTLVVCDDLEYKGMDKKQKQHLNRLYGFCSTHKNISVILCSQDPFNVPPIVRRCSNLWILWKMIDLTSMANTARKCGMSSDDLRNIFDCLMTNSHDSLWIDMTDKSPYPIRKNGFEIIERNN